MANFNPVQTFDNNDFITIQWSGLSAAGDIGLPVQIFNIATPSAQVVSGVAAVVTFEGSMDGGVTWAALGSGVTLTVASGTSPITPVTPLAPLIRARRTDALGSTATVYLSGARQWL